MKNVTKYQIRLLTDLTVRIMGVKFSPAIVDKMIVEINGSEDPQGAFGLKIESAKSKIEAQPELAEMAACPATLDLLREADQASGQTTEPEGLTEGQAWKFIHELRRKAKMGPATPAQKGTILHRMVSGGSSEAHARETVSGLSVAEASALIETLAPGKGPNPFRAASAALWGKTFNHLKTLGLSEEDAKAATKGLHLADADAYLKATTLDEVNKLVG